MNQLKIMRISVFDSILFFHYKDNDIEKRICLSFVIQNNNISIDFNDNNCFLKFFKFNHLSIENFLLKLITNRLEDRNILITEDDIPF